MKKSRITLGMIIYLLVIILSYSTISVLCNVDTTNVDSQQDGTVDLMSFDFNESIAAISIDAAVIYQSAFYTPEDFKSGKVTETGIEYDGNRKNLAKFGTMRLEINIPAGQIYAFSSKSAEYAQRLFINGEEYKPIGKTGDSPETVFPKLTRYTEAFNPSGDTTEIILHYSNMVHPFSGRIFAPVVGSVDNISRINQLKTFQVVVVTGTLMTAMIFFFGLFLFSLNNKYLLWFSLICGCIALRGLITGDKILMLLVPELSWFTLIRMEYLACCGLILFSALYLNALFAGAASKWVIHGFSGFCILNAILFSVVSTMIFARIVWFSLGVTILFFAYSLTKIFITVFHKKDTVTISRTEQILLITGATIYLVLAALEIYAHEMGIYLWGLDFAQVGLLVFLFLNILSLVLRFFQTQQELDRAKHNEREMEEANQMLERLDRLRTDFLSNISHEMRTPLMVMSGYAQLTSWQIEAGSVNDETLENLRIVSKEAQRLAHLAAGLLRVSADETWKRSLVSLPDIFGRADATCRPILEKNGNLLKIKISQKLPSVQMNEEMILQVLLNLIVNANRNTQNGVISLGARKEAASVIITVEDNGKGIEPELLSHVFERHVSGNGSSGLGLAICKEVVEAHDGQIYIENRIAGGVCVTFSLPVDIETKEEEERESDHITD